MRVFRLSANFAQAKPLPLIPASVVTIGNFDGFHKGHLTLLAHAKAYAKEWRLPVCALTFEPHPREYFLPESAPPRLSTLREKLEIFQDLAVDYVGIAHFNQAFAQVGAEEFVEQVLVRQLGVQQLIIGDDFVFGKNRQGDFSVLQQLGRRPDSMYSVTRLPTVFSESIRTSSSSVRAALSKGDLGLVQQLLGRPYTMDGHVVTGRQLGRQLGFPTANLYIRHHPLPLTGVFAVKVIRLEQQLIAPLFGVANLGIRPTVGGGTRPLLEVHLFDFDQNLYNKHLTVAFCHKIRAELKFPDLNSLQRQIAQDRSDAQQFFSTAANRA